MGRGLVRLAGGLAVVVAAACAPGVQRVHPDQQTLDQSQLSPRQFNNALEAVQALRSNWLVGRPNSGLVGGNDVQVYLDGVRLGGIQELRYIGLRQVFYIRHYDSLQATERWGLGHNQDVIFVSTHPSGFSEQ